MSDEPRKIGSSLVFDGMTWPNPQDPNEVGWRLVWGTPSKSDLLNRGDGPTADRGRTHGRNQPVGGRRNPSPDSGAHDRRRE